MSERYRVSTAPKSFDIERFAGMDKTGAEVWAKVAYCRSRTDLLASLKSRGLSESLADKVPTYHHDAYRALALATERPEGRSEAQVAALEKAHAARRAKKAGERVE